MSERTPTRLKTEMDSRRLVLETLDHVLAVLEPGRLVRDALDSRPEGRIRVVALGKAAPSMARGAHEAIGDRITAGLVVCDRLEVLPSPLVGVTGSHPVADWQSVRAGAALREFLVEGAGDLLVVLVSGGASAMVELPKPGLNIEAFAEVIERLSAAGTPIEEINTVRRHLSLLKNGGVAAFAKDRAILTLVISDVVGGKPEVVGSGPTLEDASTPGDAMNVLHRRLGEVPEPIREAVRAPRAHGSRRNEITLLAGVEDVATRAIDFLTSAGAKAKLWTDRLEGEAADAARRMVTSASPGRWLVAAGETTVTGAEAGSAMRSGGRNQEAALSAAIAIEGTGTLFAALATDGRDGPTRAGGGIVDGFSAHRMRTAGLLPERHLDEHNSLPALDSSGDLIETGPTGNNLGDLWLCFGGESFTAPTTFLKVCP